MSTFSERLAEAVKAKDCTQAALAAAAGVSEPAVSLWLKEDAVPDKIGALGFYRACVYLNRSVEYMLTGKGPKYMSDKDPDQTRLDIAALLDVARAVIEALTLTTPSAGAWVEHTLSRSALRERSPVIDQALVAAQTTMALLPSPQRAPRPETSA